LTGGSVRSEKRIVHSSPVDERRAPSDVACWESVRVNEAVRKPLREWYAAVLQKFRERASFLPPKQQP
jgi:hypothetical protein